MVQFGQVYFIHHLFTYKNIDVHRYFLCPGSFDRKSIGGSHGSLRPELAILEKIFSLPKIIFFLVFFYGKRCSGTSQCISFCNMARIWGLE